MPDNWGISIIAHTRILAQILHTTSVCNVIIHILYYGTKCMFYHTGKIQGT